MARRRGRGEGTIYQDAHGRYVAQIQVGRGPDGRRLRQTIYGATRHAVAVRLDAIRRAIEQNLPIVDEAVTVGAYLAWWLREQAAPRLRPRTLESYAQTIRDHLTPHIGTYSLARLTPLQLQAWIDARAAAGVSARTCGYARAVLRSALQDAVRLELATRNVARLVRVPRYRKAGGQALTPPQAQALLAAIAGHPDDGLVLLTLALGLREGEVLGLAWADLGVAEQALHVRQQVQLIPDPVTGRRRATLVEPKTTKSQRSLSLPPVLLDALERQRARVADLQRLAGERWRDHGLIFPSRVGTPRNPRNLARTWHQLRAAAGLPTLRFHDLRHSTTTFLLMLGAEPRTVADMLGHAQVTTTLGVYAHALRPQMVDASRRLGELLTPPTVDAEGTEIDETLLGKTPSPSKLTH